LTYRQTISYINISESQFLRYVLYLAVVRHHHSVGQPSSRCQAVPRLGWRSQIEPSNR